MHFFPNRILFYSLLPFVIHSTSYIVFLCVTNWVSCAQIHTQQWSDTHYLHATNKALGRTNTHDDASLYASAFRFGMSGRIAYVQWLGTENNFLTILIVVFIDIWTFFQLKFSLKVFIICYFDGKNYCKYYFGRTNGNIIERIKNAASNVSIDCDTDCRVKFIHAMVLGLISHTYKWTFNRTWSVKIYHVRDTSKQSTLCHRNS